MQYREKYRGVSNDEMIVRDSESEWSFVAQESSNQNDKNYSKNRLILKPMPLLSQQNSNCNLNRLDKNCDSGKFNPKINIEMKKNKNIDENNIFIRHNNISDYYNSKSMKKISSNNGDDVTLIDHEKLMRLISKLNKNLEKAEITFYKQEMNEKIKKQWTLLSKVADRLLLYIFIFLNIFILGSIINEAPNAKFI